MPMCMYFQLSESIKIFLSTALLQQSDADFLTGHMQHVSNYQPHTDSHLKGISVLNYQLYKKILNRLHLWKA